MLKEGLEKPSDLITSTQQQWQEEGTTRLSWCLANVLSFLFVSHLSIHFHSFSSVLKLLWASNVTFRVFSCSLCICVCGCLWPSENQPPLIQCRRYHSLSLAHSPSTAKNYILLSGNIVFPIVRLKQPKLLNLFLDIFTTSRFENSCSFGCEFLNFQVSKSILAFISKLEISRNVKK